MIPCQFTTSILALACLATMAPACAQEDPPTRQPVRPTQPSTVAVTEGDRVLASWIAAANSNEIQLAQAAQQSAQNPEVKQFAEMMIKDHGEFGSKLQKFTGGMLGETDGTTGRSGDRKGAGERTETGGRTGTGERTGAGSGLPADAGARRSAGALNYVALVEELGRKHLASAKQMLAGKSGAEYDRCYMGMQIMAHSAVLDKLEVFGTHASPELRSVFEAGQQTVRSHLEKAKEIAKRLESGTGTPGGSGATGGTGLRK